MNSTPAKSSNIAAAEVSNAAKALRDGNLIILPTETVYGLGADATNGKAVARIFEMKGRPQFNPLIAHILDLEMAKSLANFDPVSEKLAKKFWPGPLTLVLPILEGRKISELVTAGLGTIAMRAPRHPIARAVLREFNKPIAAPSANVSGKLSPTNLADVSEKLSGHVDVALDGGPCTVGLESTIIMVRDNTPYLLREGGLSREKLERFLGQDFSEETEAETPASPGQLLAHYAPTASIRIGIEQKDSNHVHIGFGDGVCDLNLSPSGDLVEAAANLFAHLHKADTLVSERNYSGITVSPVPDIDLGRAINDRLKRAANGS